MKPILTIFTPTYNRAYCLNKCYESMKKQSCKDFIWLVIDDGSTDNTKQLVSLWMQNNNKFEIKYIYKENGGMHTAYNTAYDRIDTELAMNIDSDDYLTDNAVESIIDFWNKNKRSDCGGFYALDAYSDGSIVGIPFPKDLKEFQGWGNKYIIYNDGDKKKIFRNRGDKKFIGVMEKINKFPSIPVFEGEKYHSLYFKQHLIERDYTILIMNKPVCVVEYLQDGSSKNMFSQYINNPNGFLSERNYVMEYSPLFRLKLSAAVHYVAESIIAQKRHFIINSKSKFATILALVPGVILYFIIKLKTR